MVSSTLGFGSEIPDESHFVRFYEQDDRLLREVSEFFEQALRAGGTAVMIATPEHRAIVTAQLQRLQDEQNKTLQPHCFVALDAEETLSKFLVDGRPDRELFNTVIGPIIEHSVARGGPIHAFGEMVALLCARGQYDDAIYLEALWNELSAQHVFRLFCAYPTHLFASSDHIAAFQKVCGAHNHICPSESIASKENPEAIRRLVATWEQKASALEAEVARRHVAESALRHSESELKDFVENAAEGLHRVSGEGIILWANRAELELLGYTEQQYVGRHIAEFHVDAPVIEAMLEALAAGATLRDQPARLRCADGSIKHVLINSNGCFQNGKFLYTRCLTRDATDRVERQQAQDQLRNTLINSPIATALLTGSDHVFRIANKRYADLTGSDSLVGQRFADALPAWHQRGITEALDQVFKTGQAHAMDEFCLRLGSEDDSSERVFNIHLEPLRGIDGSIEGIITSVVDLTQQVRDRQQLQNTLHERSELLAQLEETSRAKDEFLAMLGHELRNPLAPIVTALQLMRMRGDTGTEREQAVIQRQVDHLIQLIADLLDISKVTRGLIDLHKEWISVGSVLTKAVEMASPLFEQRSHRLIVDANDQLFVDGDAMRLAQVVSNLLSNAARYTPIGGEIHLSARRDDWEHIVISVRDNGVGIAADMLPKIFDLFFQGARDGGRAEGGLGIGLALVKSFVEKHGGTASVYSDGAGLGSEFTVRLPMALSNTTSHALPKAQALSAAPGANVPLNIMVVDDNVDAAETLARFLSNVGHHVRVVNCPTAALVYANTFVPDLAILDIGLPVMDGYELAAQLQLKSEWAQCEFVALTGYGQDADRARSKVAGFSKHFVKPIDPQELLRFAKNVKASKNALH